MYLTVVTPQTPPSQSILSSAWTCCFWSRSLQSQTTSLHTARHIVQQLLKIENNPAERISPYCQKGGRAEKPYAFWILCPEKRGASRWRKGSVRGINRTKAHTTHIHVHGVRFWRSSFQIIISKDFLVS